jgi:hypothetical protein
VADDFLVAEAAFVVEFAVSSVVLVDSLPVVTVAAPVAAPEQNPPVGEPANSTFLRGKYYRALRGSFSYSALATAIFAA